MNFDLLKLYIENKLYKSVEEAHEKIVIYYATGDLTDGEFIELYHMLYPVTEVVSDEIMLLTEEDKVELNLIPQSAIDILYHMLNSELIEDADHKADLLYKTGQLDDTLYDFYQMEYNGVKDTPTILPEF